MEAVVVSVRPTEPSAVKDTPPAAGMEERARAIADAVAAAIARYNVAYSHDTLADMSTANRSWKIHESGEDDPFERGEWLGEFDNKQDARALAERLRREAAVAAVTHLLAREVALPTGGGEAMREAIAADAESEAAACRHAQGNATNYTDKLYRMGQKDALLLFAYRIRDAGSIPTPQQATVEAGEVERLREALTPSAETKAAYHGEFQFNIEYVDEDGNSYWQPHLVPWDQVKEIMAAILKRAALTPTSAPAVDG